MIHLVEVVTSRREKGTGAVGLLDTYDNILRPDNTTCELKLDCQRTSCTYIYGVTIDTEPQSTCRCVHFPAALIIKIYY